MASILGALRSKTIWFNLIAMGLGYLVNHQELFAGLHLDAQTQVVIMALVNWALRFTTKESLAAKVTP